VIGLVIVAHADLAQALLSTTEHVVGKQKSAKAIAVGPDDDLRTRQAEIDAAVAEVDSGAGVVVVTDMFGGTPSNLAHGAMTGGHIEVIYGANLPLLVKLAKMREHPLHDAVNAALHAGRKYVNSAAAILEPGKAG
jgi:PTS system mannose-specific IIA component